VQARVQEAVRQVGAFEPMSDEQLAILAANMKSATWRRGEYVFEQGDEGDSFYVITSGWAVVLRDETAEAEAHHLHEDDEEVAVLANLSEGACFGERALLRAERRFASVQVKSEELHVKMMTRSEFEALFEDMSALMRDNYS
jgi:CRP-like cAMP-binding protein